MISNYLLEHHKEDLNTILQDSDDSKHFSINIKLDRLLQDDPSLANNLLKEFDSLLKECNASAIIAQNVIIEDSDNDTLILKNNVNVRLYNFPPCPELVRTVLPKNQDVGLFLEVSGTIVRTTAVKLLEYQKSYKCKKCKQTITVEADFEQMYLMIPPTSCSNSECNGTTFVAETGINRANSKDYQEIKIQEQISHLTVGLLPNSLWVVLEDDLVDSCKPGDNVTICGIVKRRWRLPAVGKKIKVEIVIKANHICVNNDITSITIITPEIKEYFLLFWQKHKNNVLEGRDHIVKSFCPQVYGLFLVKLAIMVTLAGGSQFQGVDDTRIKTRSEPHLLLVGDPGTGKSQLLRFAAKIISRSVFTTGVGSTSAGLTVTAVNENGEWQLEAGALVLSDGGVCCIDEFNSMKEHDRTSIHEAMEQQTISVAKASIVCKLNTRCSILAATNPKGNMDSSQALSLNIALPSPLLSRFDLVLVLKDAVDRNWDVLVADYILNGYVEEKKRDSFWDIQMLQAYVIYIKKIQPTLTEDTNRILSAYYQLQRKAELRNKARTTVRLLDSLVRLSQGHAKLMCHHEVEVVDAVMAVILVEASMHGYTSGHTSILGLEFDLLSSSPENPVESYIQLIRATLSKLQLFDLLEKELWDLQERIKQTEVDGEVQNIFEASNDFKKMFKKKSSTSASIVILKRNIDENFNRCNKNKKIKLNTSDEATTSDQPLNATLNVSTIEKSSLETQESSLNLKNENPNSKRKNINVFCDNDNTSEKDLSQNTKNKELQIEDLLSNDLQEIVNDSLSQGNDGNILQVTKENLELNKENHHTPDQNIKIISDSIDTKCIKQDLNINKLSQNIGLKNMHNQFRFKPRRVGSVLKDFQDIKLDVSEKGRIDYLTQNLKGNINQSTKLNTSAEKGHAQNLKSNTNESSKLNTSSEKGHAQNLKSNINEINTSTEKGLAQNLKSKTNESTKLNISAEKFYAEYITLNLKSNTNENTTLNASVDNHHINDQTHNDKTKQILNTQDMSQDSRNRKFINQFCYKSKTHITSGINNDQIEEDKNTSQTNSSQSIFDKLDDYDDLDLEI